MQVERNAFTAAFPATLDPKGPPDADLNLRGVSPDLPSRKYLARGDIFAYRGSAFFQTFFDMG